MGESGEDSHGGSNTGGTHISRQRSTVSLHWGAPVARGQVLTTWVFCFCLQFVGPEETQQQEREAD